ISGSPKAVGTSRQTLRFYPAVREAAGTVVWKFNSGASPLSVDRACRLWPPTRRISDLGASLQRSPFQTLHLLPSQPCRHPRFPSAHCPLGNLVRPSMASGPLWVEVAGNE